VRNAVDRACDTHVETRNAVKGQLASAERDEMRTLVWRAIRGVERMTKAIVYGAADHYARLGGVYAGLWPSHIRAAE
jgi:hypothetical protein